MKRAILLSFVLVIAVAVNAQTAATTTTAPVIELLQVKEAIHDFGKIPQGRPATYTFEVFNSGKEPLKLDNVQAACGCTTPQWNKDAIPAGGSTKIIVGYNAYAEGPFEKTITVTYNGNQTKVLTIKGNVYKAPPSSAPENASVRFLKSVTQ
ncbi:MAG TPA: DUF1573 domain-containing protein [Chitinophagaceae bacterium]|nr:DUF1573 domain-containing protein [Chitinophagaceae bacterium]